MDRAVERRLILAHDAEAGDLARAAPRRARRSDSRRDRSGSRGGAHRALTADTRIRSVLRSVVDLRKLNPPQREAASHGGGPAPGARRRGLGQDPRDHVPDRAPARAGHPAAGDLRGDVHEQGRRGDARARRAPAAATSRPRAQLTIGTFHALGLQILRTERKALGLPRGFAIYDQSDQMGALREALRHVKDMSRDGERRFDVKAILTRISLAKNAFVAPEEYAGNPADDYDAITAQVYPKYQEMLRACAAFDFDDLIVEPVRLFETRRRGRASAGPSRFRYVMVDEFQDTNAAQLRMVKHLVAQHGNLCVVGDDDQSIYSWRGADPTNILRFDELFPGAKIVKLEQNYRSTKTILAAANAVIAQQQAAPRQDAVVAARRRRGDHPRGRARRRRTRRSGSRARSTSSTRTAGRGTTIAVLYRSNIQAKILEEELRTASVPYVMYGGQQFFERKEVKDVIAYLRVALNPRDELALRRIINYPARGIGATTVERLVARGAGAARDAVGRAARARSPGPATLPGMGADAVERRRRSARRGADGRRRRAARRGAQRDPRAGPRRVRARRRRSSTATDVVAATRALIEDIKLYDDLRHAVGQHGGGAAPDRQRRGPARLAPAVRRQGQGPRAARRVPAHAVARVARTRSDDARRQGRADHAARREGPRVPGLLHDRARGGAAAAHAHAAAAGDRRASTPITRPTSARSAGSATSASRARSASCT